MKFLQSLFPSESSKMLKKIQPLVEQTNALEAGIKKLTDEELQHKTIELREKLSEGKTLDDILPEAFAVVREAALRKIGMRHYDVQLIGGIVLHKGDVTEMRTGEGKTLVATLPIYLNALSGKGVHLVTVNDYLARRDMQWMGEIYDFLGLSIGVINGQGKAFRFDPAHTEELDRAHDLEGSFRIFEQYLKPCPRKEAYDCDITYGTNNEFGFDYLRDNTAKTKSSIVQRGHSYVLIDEVDSVLIDEARVPLILSTNVKHPQQLYQSMDRVARNMQNGEDFTIDEKLKAVEFTQEGMTKAENLLQIKNLYDGENISLIHHLQTAVRAHALYEKDKDYVVKGDQVVIVDPFTGRMQDGRRWSDGLHQAIETKEQVTMKEESKTMASITYQNYFKFYDKLSGMTGTGATSQEEFEKVYGLDVIVIPTNKPIARDDKQDLIYITEKDKISAIVKKVKELQQKGQPVLIGTASVEKSELFSREFSKANITHQVLNAKNHEAEGLITAQAGKNGSVTIATNMAGRGVDIKLGGSPVSKEAEEGVKAIGGLYVIGTERHEARRIDNQLRGRSGRQGDPGETQMYISMDDNLMRVFGGDKVKNMLANLGLPEGEAITNRLFSKQLEKAQDRIEGFHFDGRKHTLQYDDILSKHRNTIYARRKLILDKESVEMSNILTLVKENCPDEQKEKLNSLLEKLQENQLNEILTKISLHVIDGLWMEHLEVMERTRRSVNLRAYGQREPLVEYKKESLRLFRDFEKTFVYRATSLLLSADIKIVKKSEQKNVEASEKTPEASQVKTKEVVRVQKGGTVREVKKKKLQQYLDTGWTIFS